MSLVFRSSRSGWPHTCCNVIVANSSRARSFPANASNDAPIADSNPAAIAHWKRLPPPARGPSSRASIRSHNSFGASTFRSAPRRSRSRLPFTLVLLARATAFALSRDARDSTATLLYPPGSQIPPRSRHTIDRRYSEARPPFAIPAVTPPLHDALLPAFGSSLFPQPDRLYRQACGSQFPPSTEQGAAAFAYDPGSSSPPSGIATIQSSTRRESRRFAKTASRTCPG